MPTKILSICVIALLVVAFASIFVPLVKVQMPLVGEQSVSVFDSLKSGVSSAKKSVEKSKDSGGKGIKLPEIEMPKIKVFNLKELIVNQSKDTGVNILKEKPVYALIPVGTLGGVLAHLLLIVILAGVLLKKNTLTMVASLSAGICSGLFLINLFLMNDLLQSVFSSPVKGLDKTPFAGIANVFSKSMSVKIEPGIAVYVLLASTLAIAIVSFLKKK